MLFLAGFLAGACLWALGWSSGGHLFEVPADDPGRTHAQAAAILALAGLAIGALPRGLDGRRSSTPLVLGLTLGLATSSLGAPLAVASGSGPGAWILVALGLTPLALRAGTPYEASAATRPAASSLLPLLLSAAALAAGTALLARGLHRALPADGADAGLVWTTFLLLASLACLVLAPLARGSAGGGTTLGDRPPGLAGLPWGAAAAPLGLALGLRALAQGTRPSGLRDLLQLAGLDASDAGTLGFDALLAASVLGPAALAAGCLLGCAREGRAWVALGLGAALGVLIAPHLPGTLSDGEGPVRTGLAHALVAVAIAGGIAALLQRPRLSPSGLAIAGTALAAWASPGLLPIPRAWVRFPVDPIRVVEGTAGQLWVEPAAEGAQRVRLDHRALTGAGGREAIDAAVLSASLGTGGERVLLVGQLDLPRAAALVEAGVVLCDRTASWSELMGEVPTSEPDPAGLLPGEVLAPAEAWRRYQDGAYDLVVAMPVEGRGAGVPLLDEPVEGCRVVAWLDPAAPVARLELGESVLLSAAGVLDFAVGVESGASEENRATAVSVTAAGAPSLRPLGLERLLERPQRWVSPNRAAVLKRLADAGSEELAPFLRALAQVHREQVPSSPFESAAEAFELAGAGLEQLVASATPLQHEPFVVETLMGAAEVLVQKRRIAELLTLFEPLSQAWGRPGRLELALAAGDLEALDAERALGRLEQLDASDPRVAALLNAARELDEGR